MTGSDHDAVFRFSSAGLTVEFEGPEEFVAAQLELVREKVRAEMKLGAGAAQAAGGTVATPPAAASLPEFYERARSREGRGALQETILIFAFFLREYRSQRDFSIDNLNACFNLVGAPPPKNLANTLGIMKRNQGFFESGSARGHYTLTDSGTAYVQRLIGAQ